MREILGVLGATIGAVAGYFLFELFLSQGFYAMVLPGAAVGLGCALFSRVHSLPLGIFSAVAALSLGCYLEWKFFPFANDDSFNFFVKNLHQLSLVTWLMIGGGAIIAFSLGKGHRTQAPPVTPANATSTQTD